MAFLDKVVEWFDVSDVQGIYMISGFKIIEVPVEEHIVKYEVSESLDELTNDEDFYN